MEKKDESKNKRKLTREEIQEIMTYPNYLQPSLKEVVLNSQLTVKEAYKEVEELAKANGLL